MVERCYADVSITYPGSPSLIANRRPAETRERQKIRIYQAMCEAENVAFFPFVMESYGFIPKTSLKLIKSFLLPPSERNESNPYSIREILQIISITLQKGNARIAVRGLAHARRAALN